MNDCNVNPALDVSVLNREPMRVKVTIGTAIGQWSHKFQCSIVSR